MGIFKYVAKRPLSVFSKILAAFFIVIFPVYLIGVLINVWGQNDVRTEVVNAEQSKISFYANLLEMEFENVLKLQTRLISDGDFRAITSGRNISEEDRFMAVNNLRTTIGEMKQFSRYIEEVSVYVPTLHLKISDGFVGRLPEEEFEAMRGMVTSSMLPFSKWKEKYYISISPNHFGSAANEDLNSAVIISVRLSDDEIKKVFKQIMGTGKVRVMLLGGRHGLDFSNGVSKEEHVILKDFFDGDGQNRTPSGIKAIKVKGTQWIVSYQTSKALDSTLVAFAPEESLLGSLSRYKLWFWVATVYTLLFIIIFSVIARRAVVRPLKRLIQGFKSVEAGELNITLDYKSDDEFGHIYRRFNLMCTRLKTLIEEVYEKTIHARNAELKQLQYQINPHFLYNSMFIIYRMAKMNDSDSVMQLSQHLGNFYKFITRSSSDEVALESEVGHMQDYIAIQNIRFGERITVKIDPIPEGCKGVAVPRLILQPIVENCFSHGLKDCEEGGMIHVGMHIEGDVLVITVEDNGGIEEESLAKQLEALRSTDYSIESTALVNVHRRLQIKYGLESGVQLSIGHGGGLRVELKIVLKGENICSTC